MKKVEIEKENGGGKRMLGIPTVIDRLISQSIAQWLSPQYEKEFSHYSYGFRENRSPHQAVYQAQTNLNDGYEWVVELGLETFFDRVNHDKLMSILVKKITDKRTLKLLRAYLNCGIMDNGVVIERKEGTPQGSPLSPLLSNIVLNELDKELEARGHRYVRFADDCSIYGEMRDKIKKMEAKIVGWVNYFRIATAKSKMVELDKLVRTRLRMGIWKQWKRPKTRWNNLKKLGINPGQASEWANSRKGYCRIANSAILHRALNNEYFAKQGYIGFANHYYWKTTHQTKLF